MGVICITIILRALVLLNVLKCYLRCYCYGRTPALISEQSWQVSSTTQQNLAHAEPFGAMAPPCSALKAFLRGRQVWRDPRSPSLSKSVLTYFGEWKPHR